MKKIANSLKPIAALALFGTCLVTVFDLVEVLMTSVGSTATKRDRYQSMKDKRRLKATA
jgi:hypothetical protein